MKNLLVLSAFVVAMLSCKHETQEPVVTDPNANQVNADDPVLSQSLVNILDTMGVSKPVNTDDILLPNGMTVGSFRKLLKGGRQAAGGFDGVQLRKNELIYNMIFEGNRLFGRADFVKLDESTPENPNRPAQPNGIAYGYGNKDYTVRRNPDGKCYEEVYGLDCSGFLGLCAAAADLKLRAGGVVTQSDTAVWNAALRQNPSNKNSYMKQLSPRPSIDQLETGDIICWNGHIGFVGELVGKKLIFQSNGSSANDCADDDCIKKEQEKNRSTKRGPHYLQLSNYSWFGENYQILRLTTDISGTWSVRMRCQGQTSDALVFDLEIPKEKASEANSDTRKVTATATGTDYDGSPIQMTLSGTYNKRTNTMEADMAFTFPKDPGSSRVDSFTVRLNMDDTDYFSTTKKVNNGGCQGEVRLINKSSTKQGARSIAYKNDSRGFMMR